MFKEKLKGFIAGVCVTAMIAGAATVFAQNIDAYIGGIKVYWDGVEKTLLDAKGDKVEPMIYDGTTYVPLRAMSNLMGKEVSWNQQEMTVYVGTTKVAATTPIDQFPKDLIQDEDVSVRTGKDATFNLKNKVIECSNLLKDENGSNTYILDGQYNKLTGKAVMPYEKVGSSGEGYITFYSVKDDGTKTEIAKYDMKQTQDPIDVDVNLAGVQNLEISFYTPTWTLSGMYSHYYVALYDASFLAE